MILDALTVLVSSHGPRTLPVCKTGAMGEFGPGTGATQTRLRPRLNQSSALCSSLSACQSPRQMPQPLCNYHSYERNSIQEQRLHY